MDLFIDFFDDKGEKFIEYKECQNLLTNNLLLTGKNQGGAHCKVISRPTYFIF